MEVRGRREEYEEHVWREEEGGKTSKRGLSGGGRKSSWGMSKMRRSMRKTVYKTEGERKRMSMWNYEVERRKMSIRKT